MYLQVAVAVDEYGNNKYHTLGQRTILKHADRLLHDASYKPMSKGGTPTVINSPDGAEFISFLRGRFLKRVKTAKIA